MKSWPTSNGWRDTDWCAIRADAQDVITLQQSVNIIKLWATTAGNVTPAEPCNHMVEFTCTK